MSGLKDHEIAALVNAVRDELHNLPHTPFLRYGPLRDVISRAVVAYLEREGLRIDKPEQAQLFGGAA